MSKSLSFFATNADLRRLLAAAETNHHFRYVLGGSFPTADLVSFDSGRELPDLGFMTFGDQNRGEFYLIGDNSAIITPRLITHYDGTSRFDVDQELNPETIVFRPGGVFQDNCIIAGQVGTCTTNDASAMLIRLFSKEIRKQFSKVKSYYVGNEARTLWETGLRLTANVRAPVEYDLRPN